MRSSAAAGAKTARRAAPASASSHMPCQHAVTSLRSGRGRRADRDPYDAAVPAALVEVQPDSWDALLHALGLTDAYLGRGFVRASAAHVDAAPVLLHQAGA